MPFPGPHAGSLAGSLVGSLAGSIPGSLADGPEAREPAVSRDPDFLAGLPLPTLVHRDGAILAANQAALALTGYADVPALTTAGLERLFRGVPQPDGPEPAARRTAVAAADGSSRPVEVMGGACTWEGRAATCLVLRPSTRPTRPARSRPSGSRAPRKPNAPPPRKPPSTRWRRAS
ncbi:hypothetical protein [Methylobacterium sp. WL1]|uniref:hypothetical protein n=1 Tax=Methylobacterium sp. WL1 TaxID=2603276 RepID=UPI00248481B9|nr:hypothetical protein [Methylobacterium sp. WL1]